MKTDFTAQRLSFDENIKSGSAVLKLYLTVFLGQHCVLPGTIPRPETSEEGGCGHHEQHSPNLQHQVTDDQEGVDEGSKT